MCKFNLKSGNTRIDHCMRQLIIFLNQIEFDTIKILACCCGHSKYPITIVVRNLIDPELVYELLSGTIIPRKKRFYKRDKQGYYYIPEVSDEK